MSTALSHTAGEHVAVIAVMHVIKEATGCYCTNTAAHTVHGPVRQRDGRGELKMDGLMCTTAGVVQRIALKD